MRNPGREEKTRAATAGRGAVLFFFQKRRKLESFAGFQLSLFSYLMKMPRRVFGF